MTVHTLSAVARRDVTRAPRTLDAPARRIGATGRLDLLTDAAAVVVALALVSLVHGPLDVAVALATAVVWPTVAAGARARGAERTLHGPLVRARRVLRGGAGLALVMLAVHSLAPLPLEPVGLLTLVGALVAVSASGRLVSSTLAGPGRLLVVGHEADVVTVVSELAGRHRRGLAPVAVCSLDEPAPGPLADLPPATRLASVADIASEHDVDAVLVLRCHHVTSRVVQRIGWRLAVQGVHLYVGTGLRDVSPARASLTRLGGQQAVHIRPVAGRGAARAAKDATERLVAAVALLVLLPVLLGIAVAVRRDSPGPALFRQERVGRDGARFMMLKFRTMHVTAEAQLAALVVLNQGAGVLFKLHQDPRVTRVGGFLRRWSLDELPQLLNVVRGDMALVGPRPALPEEVERYDADPRRRLAVKPGLTGLWQVSGRSDLSWEESVRLDLAYVDNWSPGLDLRIVLRTFGAVLRRRGAY